MSIKQKYILAISIFLSTSQQASAVMNVMTNAWPEQSSGYYGNGQTQAFKRAVNGVSDGFSEEEKKAINQLVPIKEEGHWYGKLGLNWGTHKISKVKNTLNATKVTKTSNSDTQRGLQLAVGYIWKDIRADGEYLSIDKIKFDQNPILNAPSALTSTVKGDVLLANVYYDFKDFFIFRPYVQGTAGISRNIAEGTYNGASFSSKKTTLAFGLGAGARFRLYKRFMGDVSYRYLLLGKVNWALNNTLKLEGTRSLSSFAINIIYIF